MNLISWPWKNPPWSLWSRGTKEGIPFITKDGIPTQYQSQLKRILRKCFVSAQPGLRAHYKPTAPLVAVTFSSLFRFLSEGSRTFDEIDSALKTALQAGWKSKNQTSFRLSWLCSLGYVEKEGHAYAITLAGRAVLDGLPAIENNDDKDEIAAPAEETVSPLVKSENTVQAMSLARALYEAVCQDQDKEGVLNAHSIFYILRGEHSIPAIEATIDMLQSDLIGALGTTDNGSLYTRLSPRMLIGKLTQLKDRIGGSKETLR